MLYVILMHISHFIFFCSWLITCYLFYIYFRLGKWCYTKSKFEWFSYSSSTWVIKLQRQLATSVTHLAQKLLTNVQCNGGSRSFSEETRALKMRGIVAGHQNLNEPIETNRTVWKGRKIWYWKTNPPSQQASKMLLEKSRQIAPEGMKRLSQSRNDALWWMCLAVKVKSNAVRNNTA